MKNNKEFRSLKIIDKFKWIYSKLGVNYNVMRSILKIKLTMDKRNVPTVLNNRENKKDKNNNFKVLIITYLVMGMFLAFFIGINENIMWQMTIYFTLFMFIILSTFISDFSNVILDIKDKILIGTKGVDSKTLNAAKITHILIYIGSITLALGGFSLIVALFKGFSFFILLFVDLVLIDLFMILLTALVYLIVLKFFDGEKLKDMINIVQIILASFMAIGYQLSNKFFQLIDLDSNVNIKTWHYFLPSTWFAAPFYIIKTNEITKPLIILSLFAIVAPLMTIIIYYKCIPSFERYLEKLNSNDYINKNKKESLYFKLSKIICKDKQERAIFNFTCTLVSKEREFKLKYYPSLALAFIFPFLFIFIIDNSHSFGSYSQWKLTMSTSNKYLSIYITIALLSLMINSLHYCSEYKGAWIYVVTPIKNISSIFKGAFKGMFFKIITPIFIFESIVFIWIFDFRVIPHLIIAFLTTVFFSIMNFKLTDKELPFSKDFPKGSSSNDFCSTILTIFLCVLAAGLHFAASLNVYCLYSYGFILLCLVILLWKKSFNISLEQLKK